MCNTTIGKENKECEYYYASRHILNSNTSRRFKIFAFFFIRLMRKGNSFKKFPQNQKLTHAFCAFYSSLILRRRRRRRFRRCFTKTIIDDERRGNLDPWRRGWEHYYHEQHSKTTSACIDDEFESKSTSIRCVRIRAKFNEKVEKHSQRVVASNINWRLEWWF